MLKKKDNGQMDFFSGEMAAKFYNPKFKEGDIVRQNWPWGGIYQQAYVYWQITHVRYDCMEDDKPQYQCEVAPRGWCFDLMIFPERYLVGLDIWRPNPTKEQIEAEYARKDRPDPNECLAHINHSTESQPYSFQKDLEELFDSWPVKWREVTRGGWYDVFPEDLEADNNIRKPRRCPDCGEWFDALDWRFRVHFPKEDSMRDKCFDCVPELYMSLDMDKFLCLKKKDKAITQEELFGMANRRLEQIEIDLVREDDKRQQAKFDKSQKKKEDRI